jgi:hypothetical protein
LLLLYLLLPLLLLPLLLRLLLLLAVMMRQGWGITCYDNAIILLSCIRAP